MKLSLDTDTPFDDLLVPRTPVSVEAALPQFGPRSDGRTHGRYQIIGEVACSPPEQCLVALPTVAGNPPAPAAQGPLFVRVSRLDRLAADFDRRARTAHKGLERIHDIYEEPSPGDAMIVTRFSHGASVQTLGDMLVRRRQRLPWSVALAIFAQARQALDALADAGFAHGALSAARVRLDARQFRTIVCQVVTAVEPAPRPDRVQLARIVLPLAVSGGRELELVHSLEVEDDLVVLRDHLVEQQRADEGLVLAAFDDIGTAPPLVDVAISMLWNWVAGCARVGIT